MPTFKPAALSPFLVTAIQYIVIEVTYSARNEHIHCAALLSHFALI